MLENIEKEIAKIGCGIARSGPSYGKIPPLSPSKKKIAKNDEDWFEKHGEGGYHELVLSE